MSIGPLVPQLKSTNVVLVFEQRAEEGVATKAEIRKDKGRHTHCLAGAAIRSFSYRAPLILPSTPTKVTSLHNKEPM